MSEPRRHVLIWIAPEFLQSQGLARVAIEAGLFQFSAEQLDDYIHSAVAAGGFAMTGVLADSRHGAGIWISPPDALGLELMIPWQYVKSVVTAGSGDSRAFGWMRDYTGPNGGAARDTRNGES